MKTTVLSTLIGPSFNSNQDPQNPVIAVDIQNVVAARPKKAEGEVKLSTESAKTQTPKKPADKAPAPTAKVATVKSEAAPSRPETNLKKEDREVWLKNLLNGKNLSIDEIMESVSKVDKEWSKLSVLQYLKKPGIHKNVDGKSTTYGFKA